MSDVTLDQQILGLAMNGQRSLADVRMVRAEWFDNPVVASVWPVVQALDAEGLAIDPQVIMGHISDVPAEHRRQVTLIWLFDCYRSAPVAQIGEQYAAQLKARYWRRQLANSLERGTQLLEGNADIRQVRLEVMATLDKLELGSEGDESFTEVLDATVEGFGETSRYVQTPWDGLNEAIAGWRPGGLYVIGARPGVGKSLLLMQASLALAETGTVLFEALEMTPSEVMTRIIANQSHVSMGRLKGKRPDGSGGPSPEDWARIRETAEAVRGTDLLIRGRGVKTPLDIREHARDAKSKGQLSAVVVDYLQIMGGNGRENRATEIAAFTRQLKLMAMEFDVPVIVASQLNRESVKDGATPTLAALRESGSIEQDADVVALLNAEAPDPLDPNGEVRIKTVVAKNRQGPLTAFNLVRDGRTARIVDDYREGY